MKRGTWRPASDADTAVADTAVAAVADTVPRPLLPPPFRRAAAGLAVACAAVVLALGLRYHGQPHGGWLDAMLDPRIQGALGPFHRTLRFLADAGTLVPAALMVAALVAACLAARRWTGAVLAAVAEPAAIVLTEYLLKPLVGRTNSGSLTFPSGHATAMFALAVTVAVLLANPPRGRWPAGARVLTVLAALLGATAVALAMVALNAHYVTDAIGGAAVGTGMALACALILDRLTRRRLAPHRLAGRRLTPRRLA
ncbi:MAG: phosphatase PAP2 family protein, partial [Streptosporangiaceae bacterium]